MMPFTADQAPPQQSSGFVPDPEPEPTPSHFTPDVSQDAFKAATYGKMLDASPGYAYQNLDEIEKQLKDTGGDDFDKGIGYAIETGFEETPLGLIIRGKAPDPFVSHSHLGNFIHDVSEMVSDPLILASAFSAPEGVGIAGFAVDAALRKTLMDQYQKGDVKSFGELADRAGSILWEGAKGGLLAAAGTAAGELPIGQFLERNPITSAAMKGVYQSAAMTTAGALLNGQLPNLGDFERSAALIVPLNLATGGAFLRNTKQAVMDVYAEGGKTPQETALNLTAQPPVKPDLPEGLRPAIKIGEDTVEANEGESHDDLAARALAKEPVALDQLESDPALADKILENPEIHGQDVIDAAFKVKKEAIERGESDDELPQPGKSGRGFVTPDGKFLERSAAKKWMKDNEPQVHDMWEQVSGDAQAELHAEDYGTARFRVNGRNVAEGEPDLSAASPELQRFLGVERAELNRIKAGDTSKGYGHSVIRTLFVGPRNTLRAATEQVASGLRELIPEYRDQEALSFMRDYRDDPAQLQKAIEEIRTGKNEKLTAYIPSMERALNPSPEMMQADQQMTQYFKRALDMGRQLGMLDSSIDPSRYSPRLFMKAMEEGATQKGIGRPKFTEKTANAIRRNYLRVLDPLKSGEIEARTFNSIDELGVYGDRFATSAATKLFTTELKNSEMGKWGSSASVPEDWRELAPSQRGFHQSVKNPATGETFQRAFYVPKVVADAMRPIVESGGLPEQVAGFLHAQQLTKGIELGLSAFHMKALTITAMNNMSLGDFTRALASDNASPEFQAGEREGALWGLETTKTGPQYEAYKGLKPSSLPRGLDKLADIPVIKQVDAFAQSITRETFDVIQRKFKVMDFSQKQAAWIAKHPQASEGEYGSAMRGIAKEVNAAYGGLNWDVMGVSKQMRDISRLFMLAPDWTFSNVANLKYAGEGGPAGSAARKFWVKSFVTGYAMTAAMSTLVGGKWEMKHPEMVYLGKDKENKDLYANMFFAGAPKDAITLMNRVMKDGPLTGLAEFMVGKAGPFAGATIGLAMNKDYQGRPIAKKEDSLPKKTGEQIAFVAGKVVPITAGNITETAKRLLSQPVGSLSYKDVMEVLGGMAGVTTIHEGEKKQPAGKGGFRLPGAGKSKGGFRLP